MSDVLKQEGMRVVISLLFFSICIAILYFAMPRIADKMGAAQAKSFWRNEIFQNKKRLFGNGEDDAV